MNGGGSGGASADRSTASAYGCRPGIATVPLVRDRLRSAAIFVSMDLEYDPKREAAAAMKLAAEAKGAERQRWITAALAWSELSSLRGAAEHNVPEG
jgi:hypothetical protein